MRNWRVVILSAAAACAATVDAQLLGPLALEWRPCPLDAEDAEATAECALVPLPIDHGTPAEGAIGIAVMRHRAGTDGPRRQLWYLAGGPGDAGSDALGRLRTLFADVDVDLYTLDHRGTGGSGLLSCPDQEADDSADGREMAAEEWPACIESLLATRGDLPRLTTTQAAHDLGRLIESARGPEDRVFVFGASYGSYWANRYLESYPDQPDGVILDGLVPPDWTMAELDAGLDVAARRLLASCSDDPACREHLGADPVARAEGLPARIDGGHCEALDVDGRTIRLLLGNLLMGGPDIWPWIPGVIYRLDRCRLRDLLAIGELVERLFESGDAGQEPESHSPVLQRHVSMSELWPLPPPDPAELEAAIESTIMTTAVSASFAATRAAWPVYPSPPARFAAYTGPLLLLHGGLDPTMPVERLDAMRGWFTAPHQTFVLFPHAGHVVVNGNPCARRLYLAFLEEPTAALDTSCVATREPTRFGTPSDGESLFGTGDYWGDRPSALEWLLGIAGLAILASLALTVRWAIRRRRRRLAA